jgi:hypothetical protein
VSLSELHSRLHIHLKALSGDREGPVYLIEHPLTREELDAAAASIREEVAVHGFIEHRWNSQYLPLLVVATEVGYQFGSSGHEYWPILRERLGCDFDNDRRYILRALFRASVSRTRVEPPETSWALTYNLIAWPVAHAVLPMWLHERLLRCILRCTRQIKSGGDYLAEMLEEAASDGPLANFLSQEALASSVIEGILLKDAPAGELSKELLDRLRRDVLETPRNRSLASQVRARQIALRQARSGGRARSARPAQPDVINTVPLVLSIDGDAVSVRVPPVTLPWALPLAAERLRIRLLGTGRFVTLGGLLQDGAALPSAPSSEPSLPLVAEPDLPEGQGQLAAHLRSLRLDLRRPMLFQESSGRHLARQAKDRAFAPRGFVWVLADADQRPPPSAAASRGTLLGSPCYRCDAGTLQAQRWLQSMGLSVDQAPAVAATGSPSVDQPLTSDGAHLAGDVLAVCVRAGPIQAAGRALQDGLHLIELPKKVGPISVELTAEGARSASLSFEVATSRQERGPLAQLHLEGSATAAALRDRRLAIRATSTVPIAGLRLSLSASEAGLDQPPVRAYSAPLPALPAVVGPDDPVWEILAGAVSWTRPIELRAELGGISAGQWTLDLEDRPRSAQEDLEERPESEEARWSDGARPWEGQGAEAPSAVSLLQPVRARGAAAQLAPLLGAGTALRGQRTQLGGHPVEASPARLLRRLESDGGVGLSELTTAWLCWTTAGAEDLIAGGLRRLVAERLDLWSASALCGERWAEAEIRAGGALRASFGASVADALWREGDVRDPASDGRLPATAAEVVVGELALSIAEVEGWLRESAERLELDDQVSNALAEMTNRAYRRALLAAGVDEGSDSPCQTEVTAKALRQAITSFETNRSGAPLLALILPRSLGSSLAAVDYAAGSDAEVIGALHAALGRPEGQRWTEAQTEVLWALWARPLQCRMAALPEVLQKAAEDRGAARIIRYGALRRRAARGILP